MMISRVLIFLVMLSGATYADFNTLILEQMRSMPEGGGYATTLEAHKGLAASFDAGKPAVHPQEAMPGYCSGATYLVFLKTLDSLRKEGKLKLDADTWKELSPRLRPDGLDTLPDGESLWGRWNANGPGTARLFHELGLGPNFTDFAQARPGDFLKIFWTDAVGKKERGHLVIYLGQETRNGVEQVTFWSSNQPGGFGIKSVPRSNIIHAIFSRLEHPENVRGWRKLPAKDTYLASLLKTESSIAEARSKSGIR